jgi:MerR family redox-sensitive transcriptional activator SoxR
MLTIGQVASRTGLRASVIRYYEERGLLPAPLRTGGKRVYPASIIARLAVIELAKIAGFNLDEIRDTLSNADEGGLSARWKTLAKTKRAELDDEMRRLMVTNYVLARVGTCSCASVEECGRRFLEALSTYPPEPPVELTVRRRRSAKRLSRRPGSAHRT